MEMDGGREDGNFAGASSSGAAGASYSGAIPRGTTDSNDGVEMTAKDGKSTN